LTNDGALRADARRNRDSIIAAAETVFLEKGAGASLDDVARKAEVGIGTLYRRFPTREDLLAATYSARFLVLAETSRERAGDLNPLSAMRAYLEELIQQTNLYRGLAASLGTVLQIGTPGCLATSEEGMRLLSRAQRAGAVSQEVEFNDLICMATAISLATEREDPAHARIAHLVDIFINGIGRP
jgi:AcrR family transcriptional regulator